MTVDIRVVPRSQPEGIAGRRAGRLLVRVGAAPVDGSANQAVIALLASVVGVRKSDVCIVRGERARDKTVRIAGIVPAEARQRLGLEGDG